MHVLAFVTCGDFTPRLKRHCEIYKEVELSFFQKLNIIPISFLIISDNSIHIVGFEVLTAVVMKSSSFWDITPCNPLKVKRRFGGICRLYLQGRRISRARNQRESPWQAEAGFLLGLFLDLKDGYDIFLRNIG
jgi:hypothetical protein